MKIPGTNINITWGKPTSNQEEVKNATSIKDVQAPPGRKSKINDGNTAMFEEIKGNLKFIKPPVVREAIPLIRNLYKVNSDLGLALNDLVQLTNTGHRIKFDNSVKPAEVDRMRRHLDEKRKTWGDGVAGIDGLINKWISQIYVGGALSIEWVPDNKLRGIDNVGMVNPEEIRFRINETTRRYEPYQKAQRLDLLEEEFIKLNQNTYKYYGLNGDTEVPYGIPPFLTALDGLDTQLIMKNNIKFIIKQLGLMGFLEVLLDKPGQNSDENKDEYVARLNKLLDDTKVNVQTGFHDGVMVGYKEDHEFDFHSTTKNIAGVGDLWGQNEIQIANGLKTSPAFMGVKDGGTETAITVIFTKMLSQLGNVQDILSLALEYGYVLELKLAGFKFNTLTVEFEPSTITDDLKLQQGKEIKIRNLTALYNQGIISQEKYADEMGFEAPDQKEPRQIQEDPQGKEVDRKKREQDKDDSDRRTRDKGKPQPKRRDRDTRNP